jgi:hypothetical protein
LIASLAMLAPRGSRFESRLLRRHSSPLGLVLASLAQF